MQVHATPGPGQLALDQAERRPLVCSELVRCFRTVQPGALVFVGMQTQQTYGGEFVKSSELSPGLGLEPPHPDTPARTAEGTQDGALLPGTPKLHDLFDDLIDRESQQDERRLGDTPHQPLSLQRHDDGVRNARGVSQFLRLDGASPVLKPRQRCPLLRSTD